MKKSFVRKSAVKEKNVQENVVSAVSSWPEKEDCVYRKSVKSAKEDAKKIAKTIGLQSSLMWKKFVKENVLNKELPKNAKTSFWSRMMKKNVANRKSLRKKKLARWSVAT